MKARLAKLDRLAQRVNEGYRSEREDHDRMMGVIAAAMLCRVPDLALVTDVDTDPATYADIRSTVSYARGDWDAGRAWQAKATASPTPPRQPGESSIAWLGRVTTQIVAQGAVHIELQNQAIARARTRLGKA